MNTAVPLKEILKKTTISMEMLEHFSNTYISGITVSKKTGNVHISIVSYKAIEYNNIEAVKIHLNSLFSDCSEIELSVKYDLPYKDDTEKMLAVIKNYVVSELYFKRPIYSAVLYKSFWNIESGKIDISLINNSTYFFKKLNIDKYIEKTLHEQFGLSYGVYFNDNGNDFMKNNKSIGDNLKTQTDNNENLDKLFFDNIIEADFTNKRPLQTNHENIYENKTHPQPTAQKQKITTGGSGSVIFGKPIKSSLLKIIDAKNEGDNTAVLGEIISIDYKETKKGKYIICVFDLTDYTDSVTVKIFAKQDTIDTLKRKMKKGAWVKAEGKIEYDTFSKCLVISAKNVEEAKQPDERMDNSKDKRVELHLHTQMSKMDGITHIDKYVERAAKWGHKAIAVTDHGVVQAYPDAADISKKYGIKMIYGMEAYIADDLGTVVQIPKSQSLEDEYVVFDIETTGLNKEQDKITEIGAVKIRGCIIVDSFTTFADPQMKLPQRIIELTGITDDMLIGAPSQEEAVDAFLKFAGDAVLVAHNANFDMGFIRNESFKKDIIIKNTVIDTVELSRSLYPELSKHKLDYVCRHLGISLDNHHRAQDDAQATAEILIKSFENLKQNGISNVDEINIYASKHTNYKKLNTYHAVILVTNQKGMSNLYELVSNSHIDFFYKKPRILKSQYFKKNEGLIIGTACESGELYQAILDKKPDETIKQIVNFYDYLEIQPCENNEFLIRNGRLNSIKDIEEINKKIVSLGKDYNKMVVATCDNHFLDPKDEVFRRIIMAGEGFSDADDQSPLYYRTTEEMLSEFSYLGKEKAYEVVVENTNKIADMIEVVKPIPDETFPPEIEGASEELRKTATEKAVSIYGENLPQIVSERLDRELESIINNGFSVMYIIAKKLVNKSMYDGYLVGSRGSVGSSFAAYTAGITEVNPLPPHYVCGNCKYSDFDSDIVRRFAGASGYDMPDKKCPVCGDDLKKDGHDIPFETFLGFDGDKEPDIDLNFSGEYQQNAHAYTEELFGSGNVFKAGTIGTLAEKTAFGYVKKYFDERRLPVSSAEINRLVQGCTGIKRTTGQHPGGLMVVPRTQSIYNFTPIQRPANDTKSNVITTHFDYHSISGRLLKLDLLGHDDPTVLKMLKDMTGVEPVDVPLDDKRTMTLFTSPAELNVTPEEINCKTGTLGLPEFGTKFVRDMLMDTKPSTFAELIRISGLSHGTDVWINNAHDYIKAGKATLKEVICTRDDIMIYLISKGVEKKKAFKIMENVRKGKGLSGEDEQVMKQSSVPAWYIESCNKIKYMFPKAHAAAYVMMAYRIAYFKVHYPKAFYCSYFSVRADDFDYDTMCKGKDTVTAEIRDYEAKNRENLLTAKEKDKLVVLEIVRETLCRGVEFTKLNLYESDSKKFLIKEEKILPPLNSLSGLGSTAAEKIVSERENGKFKTVEDLKIRTGISKTVIQLLKKNGILDGMPETSQMSLF